MQACGTSLVETVNHVLDFTKLSGNAKAGGVENVIHLSRYAQLANNHCEPGTHAFISPSRRRVNLMQLVEDATEGCWIGHRARMFTSEIGSVYSPPKSDRQQLLPKPNKHVETVIDIGHSEAVCLSPGASSLGGTPDLRTATQGWTFRCEKGGIRRILMNVFGNSLKFTSVCLCLRNASSMCDDCDRTRLAGRTRAGVLTSRFVECRTGMFT